jgi:hypothetical protein
VLGFPHFCNHHFLEICRLPKRRKTLRQSYETELVGQQRKIADVGVRHFNIFLFQHQNELTEVINRAGAPSEPAAPASIGSSINRFHFIISVPTGTLGVPSGRTNSSFILITNVSAQPSRTMTKR